MILIFSGGIKRIIAFQSPNDRLHSEDKRRGRTRHREHRVLDTEKVYRRVPAGVRAIYMPRKKHLFVLGERL